MVTKGRSYLNKPIAKRCKFFKSMHGLLLPPDINELSTTEISIQIFNQNCKSQLNLIFYFFQVPP